eukprot:TRINITY_DN36600_c0_g1_i2.p1 TRINITY_DN36600_c0_g1~~TRINITY_DN36600_c0_g1_i2.p1  ORF type:complete len:204 (-),score=39.38 TRINITY_DN36600_c0_g1_i2:271-882(-)
MIRRPPRSTLSSSSAASDVYKRQVYDVSGQGDEHYGPGGGYSFFAGIDGSAGFISGDFSAAGLHDQLDHLEPEQVVALFGWVQDTYEAKYRRVGVLAGTFYDSNGSPTSALTSLESRYREGLSFKAKRAALAEEFPGCDSKWTQTEGGQVSCTVHPTTKAKRYPRMVTVDNDRCGCALKASLADKRLKRFPKCATKEDDTCPT